jgi:serine phosphatase RsbU (regulator of sigma subunit)
MMAERTILVVDDEVANLQKLQRTFVNRYPVLAATNGRDAFDLVQKNEGIAVIIADQRMPDMTGVEFLRNTLALLPDAVRIILTGYTDVDVLMDAINSCKVYRYMVKPWDPPDLLMTVERGLEAHSLALENARFRKELIRRERLARELEIARDIQRYILPLQPPALDGYEMAVEYHPAREVGGDLYDFDLDPGRNILQVVVGDVSGKSIPAALYGAVFSGQLRTLFSRSLSPSEILAFLNANLIARYQVSNYIAVCYLRLDLGNGKILLANGGMPYPYLIKDKRITRVEISGVPLGLLEGIAYDEKQLSLDIGETLVLASDGVSDALNPDGRMFDEHRFMDAMRRHCSEEIRLFVENLYKAITEFTGNAEVNDDVTIVAIRRRQ